LQVPPHLVVFICLFRSLADWAKSVANTTPLSQGKKGQFMALAEGKSRKSECVVECLSHRHPRRPVTMTRGRFYVRSFMIVLQRHAESTVINYNYLFLLIFCGGAVVRMKM
jgi:hypothetical protein